jgi:predicted ATPase
LFRDFASDHYTFLGKQFRAKPNVLCLKQAADIPTSALNVEGHPAPKTFTEVLSAGHVYRRYRLDDIQKGGSQATSERRLRSDGTNVFDVLRDWANGGYVDRPRYSFVIETLRVAFPGLFWDITFRSFGQLVAANFVEKLTFREIPFEVAPDGLLVALLHLCAIAGMEFDDYLAIDEMENALHPHAIRTILRCTSEWKESSTSREKFTTLALATHSPVVLDCFRDDKRNVFVMEPGQEVQPCRITDITDPNWLAQFSLGQVYMDGEVGGPVLNAPAPEAA